MNLTYNDLKICSGLIREAEEYTETLCRLRAMAEKSTTVISFEGKGSRGNDSMGNTAAKLVDLEKKWQVRIEKATEHVACVNDEIESLQNCTQRRILRMRYIDGWTWERISEKTHYTERHCKRIEASALKKLGIEKCP